MLGLNINQVEAYSQETFRCGSCNKEFPAKIITWVDVARAPQVKQAVMRWEFNMVQCPSCGCRQFAETPFFFEDFAEGFLVAVFPRIPEQRGTMEAQIRNKYGYYPVLEFFYDMTQLWTLLYLQEHYRLNKNLRSLSRLGTGEARIRKIMVFLKENPLMIDIRERLTEAFFGDASEDELMDHLSRAIYTLEEMLPWPQDRKCVCGANLLREFKCCGARVELDGHDQHLSRHYVVYCPTCGESLAGASCEACGRVYTWKLGTVPTHRPASKSERGTQKPAAEGRL